MIQVSTENIKISAEKLKAGDSVLLSGTVYTARDAAHKKMTEMLELGEKLPFEINGAVIYYTGPTPAREGMSIGSCGPTTSSRMDRFTPRLLDLGLGAMIGKGNRSDEVVKAIIRNGAVYFCAVGGAGAIAAKSVISSELVAFPELGCEAIRKLQIKDFPLIVGIDAYGGSILK